MSYSISGRSAIARPRSTGPGAPSASPSGSIIGKSAIARPCPDGPGAPSGDKSGYSVTGSALWRSPCDEIIDLCGITDTFERTVDTSAMDWGVSDAGVPWVVEDFNALANFYVANGNAAAYTDGSCAPSMSLSVVGMDSDFTINIRIAIYRASDYTLGEYAHFIVTDGSNLWECFVAPYDASQGGLGGSGIILGYYDGSSHFERLAKSITFTTFADPTQTWYLLKWEKTGSTHQMKLWLEGTAEPDWEVTQTGLPSFTPSSFEFRMQGRTGSEYDISDLDISGINRCTCGITDTFNRADQVGLGTADCGTAWIVSNDNDCSKIADNAAWVGQYSGGDSTNRTLTASLAVVLPLPLHIEVDMDPTCDSGTYLEWTANPGNDAVSVHLLPDPYGTLEIMLPGSSGDDAAIALAKGTLYHLVVDFDGTVLTATIGSTTVTATTSTPFTSVESLRVYGSTGSAEHDLAHFDNLAICGVNLCTAP